MALPAVIATSSYLCVCVVGLKGCEVFSAAVLPVILREQPILAVPSAATPILIIHTKQNLTTAGGLMQPPRRTHFINIPVVWTGHL